MNVEEKIDKRYNGMVVCRPSNNNDTKS